MKAENNGVIIRFTRLEAEKLLSELDKLNFDANSHPATMQLLECLQLVYHVKSL